jgi:hypothetical protein
MRLAFESISKDSNIDFDIDAKFTAAEKLFTYTTDSTQGVS